MIRERASDIAETQEDDVVRGAVRGRPPPIFDS
jgi:hypothetical protein